MPQRGQNRQQEPEKEVTSRCQQPHKLGNLPFLLSSFIGREQEKAEVRRLLGGSRLLTLTGPGGCGKTRLALEVLADLAETFEGQVWLIEYSSLTDPALLPQVVASALGLYEQPGRTSIENLVEYLQSRRVLLMLDNCEHLITACATFAETLLHTCPHLSILATSREALQIAGETLWSVPPLSLPALDPLPPLEQLIEYDAIRLFVERAADGLPGFTLTSQNAPGVVQLCQRLDGIPLALELAAARVRHLSVEQILTRLERDLHLLRGGSRTALPRQQTLWATIDWSHRLLEEQERILFRRLAVFAGGFTLEAAEAICASDGIARDEVLDLLAHLVDKSLLIVVERGEEPRYRLLETVRQYAREKLEAAGEEASVSQHHVAFFLRLVEQAEPKIRSAERPGWLERIKKEYDNVRAALAWLRDQGEMEVALQLTGALSWGWYFLSFLSEAREWLESLLAHSGTARHTPGGARSLFGAGAMAWTLGDYAAMHMRLEESVALLREIGDHHYLAYALSMLGLASALQGKYSTALALQEESQALFREVGDIWGLAVSLYWQGEIERLRRNHLPARALHQQSLALFRQTGDTWGLAVALQGMGTVAYRLRDYLSACTLLEEALDLRRKAEDQWLIAQTLNTLGTVLQAQGKYERAAALFQESLALYRRLGDSQGIIALLRSLGELAAQQSDYALATHYYEERLQRAQQSGHQRYIAECQEALARFASVTTSLREEPAQVATYEQQAAWLASSETVRTPSLSTQPVSENRRELRLFALGQARVCRNGQELPSSAWPYIKVKELLFYLLSAHPRTKEQIGLDFWPDASPAQLRSNFHETLYHVRRALGQPEWIVYVRGRYTFNRSLPYWWDVEAFETAVMQARALRADAPVQAIQTLEQALPLYQGDFLEESTSEWVLQRREQLRCLARDAWFLLGHIRAEQGQLAQAAEAFRQAITRDHYLEAAHRELIRCYAHQGEYSQAIRSYQTLVEWLRDELGTSPAPETIAIVERLRRGETL